MYICMYLLYMLSFGCIERMKLFKTSKAHGIMLGVDDGQLITSRSILTLHLECICTFFLFYFMKSGVFFFIVLAL